MARILFPVLACALLMPMGVLTGIVHDGGLRETYWVDLGDIEHLILNTSVPEGRPRIKVYELGLPSFGREWCDRQIEQRYPGWRYGRVFGSDLDDAYYYSGLDNPDEAISVYGSGYVQYFNDTIMDGLFKTIWDIYSGNDTGTNSSGVPRRFVTEEEACDIALDTLKAHGQPPEGFFLGQTKIMRQWFYNTSLIDMYRFSFQRKLDGHRMIGDGADIGISPMGQIYGCGFFWQQIKEPKFSVNVVSATEATLFLDAHLPVWWCGTQPIVKIDKIELGYHLGDLFDHWTETRPIWIFEATVGNTPGYHFYIDAVNMALIENY